MADPQVCDVLDECLFHFLPKYLADIAPGQVNLSREGIQGNGFRIMLFHIGDQGLDGFVFSGGNREAAKLDGQGQVEEEIVSV